MTHHVNWNDIHTGHNVCDREGQTIGTVTNVHEMGRAVGGGPGTGGQGLGGQGMGGQTMGSSQGYLECDCNLPGLNRLYIPLNAFTDCDGNCCRLDLGKDEISRQGWDRQPSNI